MQQHRPIARRDRAPGREGRLGRGHRGVDLLGSGPRHLGHHLLGGRLDDLQSAHIRTSVARDWPRPGRDHPAFSVLLGVPEDAEGEALARQLDRLDHLVAGRPAADPQSLPQPLHSLVVMGLHGSQLSAGRARRQRAGLQPHLVVAEAPRRMAMLAHCRSAPGGAGRGCRRGRRSASACRGRSPAPASRRSSARRTSASSKRSRSGQTPLVSGCRARRRRSRGRRRSRRRGSVRRSVPADRSGSSMAAAVGRQQQRDPTGGLHRGRVGARRHRHRFLPGAPADPLDRGADTDRRGRSQPLEAAEVLPVGDRGLERVDLDLGPV